MMTQLLLLFLQLLPQSSVVWSMVGRGCNRPGRRRRLRGWSPGSSGRTCWKVGCGGELHRLRLVLGCWKVIYFYLKRISCGLHPLTEAMKEWNWCYKYVWKFVELSVAICLIWTNPWMAKFVQALTILSERISSSGVSSPKMQSLHSALKALSGSAKQRASSPESTQSLYACTVAAEVDYLMRTVRPQYYLANKRKFMPISGATYTVLIVFLHKNSAMSQSRIGTGTLKRYMSSSAWNVPGISVLIAYAMIRLWVILDFTKYLPGSPSCLM